MPHFTLQHLADRRRPLHATHCAFQTQDQQCLKEEAKQRYMYYTLYTAVMALKWFAKHIYAGPAEQQSNELDEI